MKTLVTLILVFGFYFLLNQIGGEQGRIGWGDGFFIGYGLYCCLNRAHQFVKDYLMD